MIVSGGETREKGGQRDRETQGDGEKESEPQRKEERHVWALSTFICASESLKVAAPLTLPTRHHMLQ